ncbi:MAG: prepilin-type N-terminal cleavage/methylation domain-containing protein [Propionivibrio sp.]
MSRQGRVRGFTLVELVVILIVLGILAVVAIPRFFDNAFSERGVHDGAKAAIQHARKVAVASRRYVCAAVAAGGVTLSMDVREPDGLVDAVNCTAAVNLPVPQQGCPANQVCARPGVVLGGAVGVIFDPLGRPVNGDRSLAGAATITVTGQPNIVVQADSGWVQ